MAILMTTNGMAHVPGDNPQQVADRIFSSSSKSVKVSEKRSIAKSDIIGVRGDLDERTTKTLNDLVFARQSEYMHYMFDGLKYPYDEFVNGVEKGLLKGHQAEPIMDYSQYRRVYDSCINSVLPIVKPSYNTNSWQD